MHTLETVPGKAHNGTGIRCSAAERDLFLAHVSCKLTVDLQVPFLAALCMVALYRGAHSTWPPTSTTSQALPANYFQWVSRTLVDVGRTTDLFQTSYLCPFSFSHTGHCLLGRAQQMFCTSLVQWWSKLDLTPHRMCACCITKYTNNKFGNDTARLNIKKHTLCHLPLIRTSFEPFTTLDVLLSTILCIRLPWTSHHLEYPFIATFWCLLDTCGKPTSNSIFWLQGTQSDWDCLQRHSAPREPLQVCELCR